MIEKARKYCNLNKLRFTEPREKVLNTLVDGKLPLGAYELLEKMSTKANKINPPTIYRAIDFWIEHGFIHKIVSLNKYIACNHVHDARQATKTTILICNKCSYIEEICLVLSIDSLFEEKGFDAQQVLIEAKGLCLNCK